MVVPNGLEFLVVPAIPRPERMGERVVGCSEVVKFMRSARVAVVFTCGKIIFLSWLERLLSS